MSWLHDVFWTYFDANYSFLLIYSIWNWIQCFLPGRHGRYCFANVSHLVVLCRVFRAFQRSLHLPFCCPSSGMLSFFKWRNRFPDPNIQHDWNIIIFHGTSRHVFQSFPPTNIRTDKLTNKQVNELIQIVYDIPMIEHYATEIPIN